MAGISDDAVIWVAGESTGKDEAGNTASIPADTTPAALTTAYVDAVAASGVATRAKIVASGILPGF